MPYARNSDLSDRIRGILPEHAQDIYRRAFNGAWQAYDDLAIEQREQTAHRVAWAAVKRRYCKSGERWVPRET